MKMENLPDELLINILYQTDLPTWWVLKHVSRHIRSVVLSEAEYAIRTGKSIMTCMKRPVENIENINEFKSGMKNRSWIGAMAAYHGHIGIMHWITQYHIDTPVYFRIIAQSAAYGGHMNILRHAVDFCIKDGIDLSHAIGSAAINGQIEAMEYIRPMMNSEFDDNILYYVAADYGQLELFLHLWKQKSLWGPEMYEQDPNSPISYDAAKLFHKITEFWGKTGDTAIYERLTNEKILKLDDKYLIFGAIESGNISAVKYLLQFQKPEHIADPMRYIGSGVMKHVINSESIEMINFIRELCDYQIDNYICSHAASQGKLNILIWAHENGMPWQYGTLIGAAESGSIECLKYAHENGCDLNDNGNDMVRIVNPEQYLVKATIDGNNIDCLKYVHEVMECSLSGDIYISSIRVFHDIGFDIFKYLYDRCKHHDTIVDDILHYDRVDLLQFLHEKGENIFDHNTQFLHPESKCAKYLASIRKSVVNYPY